MRLIFPHPTGRLMGDLATDMNALVESFFSDEDATERKGFAPDMDIEETDQGYKVALDLPGVKPDDVHVEIDDDRVTIHGTRHHEIDEATKDNRRRIERRFGEFRRSLQLPVVVDKDAIVANYVDGVLTVNLPKAADSGARRIEISHGALKREG